MSRFYWEDPANYSIAFRRKYTLKANIIPIGTEIYNKLEYSKYKVTEQERIVLTGTVGEKWVVRCKSLQNGYTFEDGREITDKDISDYIRKANVKGKVEFNVTTKPGVVNWALPIPVSNVFNIMTKYGSTLTVNAPGSNHGNGDYIVCSDNSDMSGPDISSLRVVNGIVFEKTYVMGGLRRNQGYYMQELSNYKPKNYLDPSLFSPCRKKDGYNLWICRPEYGTYVINHLEHPELMYRLSLYPDVLPISISRPFIRKREYEQIYSNRNSDERCMRICNLIEKGRLTKSIYYVGDILATGIADTVLCGPLNSMWVISTPRLIELYEIKSDHIKISKETGIEMDGPILHWERIEVSSNLNDLRYSYQVPLSETTQIRATWGANLIVNDPRIEDHGNGDYIICHSKNGKPNIKSAYSVNGRVYEHEYTSINDKKTRARPIKKPCEITL